MQFLIQAPNFLLASWPGLPKPLNFGVTLQNLLTAQNHTIFLWTNVCRKKCRRQLLRSDNPVYVDLFLTHFNINFKQKPCQNFGKITPVLPARGRPYLVHHITPPPITICMNCKMRLHTELTYRWSIFRVHMYLLFWCPKSKPLRNYKNSS